MKRTAQSIEEHKAAVSVQGNGKRKGIGRGKHPNSRKGMANLKPIPKGTSLNPGGLPGTDLAAVSARRFFEEHPTVEDFQTPKGFNAYAFSVLADRGYGKLKETKEVNITGGLAVRIEQARRRVKKDA